jgi:hypothetical protein
MGEVDLIAPPGSHAMSGRRRRTGRRGRRTAIIVVAAVAAAAAGTVGALNSLSSRSSLTPACTVTATSNHHYTLTLEQAQNAAIISVVAFKHQLPDHAVTVALAVALQESKLRNLPYGDRDSIGLFQQRPSQGWGTQAQILDPVYATSAFYTRLAQISRWQTMPVTEAAQAVQLSASGGAYAAWEDEARALGVALTGEVANGLSCRLNSFGGAAPAPGAVGQVLASEMGANLLGVRVSGKTGWQIATWAVAHAYNYHLRSVSFAGQTWSLSGKWARDRSGLDPQVVRVSVG